MRRRPFISASLSRLLFIFICFSADIAQGSPQEDMAPLPAPLPAGIPAIPGGTSGEKPLYITAKNENSFEEILLAPIAAWLRDGKVALKVVRNVDSALRYSSTFEDASKKNALSFDLDSTFSLTRRSDDEPLVGTAFGFADEINQESDPVRKAYKVLWSAQQVLGASSDFVEQVEMNWIGTQSVLRSARGVFYQRTFFAPEKSSSIKSEKSPEKSVEKDTAAESIKGSDQKGEEPKKDVPAETTLAWNGPTDLFRQEMLRFSAPPVLRNFTQFSWRLRGAGEDRFWVYSPVLNTIREAVSSNRSDGILSGALTFDDIFSFAGKVQSVDARVVDQKVLLVPFPATTYYRLESQASPELPAAELSNASSQSPSTADGGKNLPPAKQVEQKSENILTANGYQKRADGTATMVLWNHETKQLPQLAPWLPTSVVFIPRRVWIIELSSKDPYYGFGREILIVDQDLLLPVYKLSYDRIGEYRKTLLTGWGMAVSRDGKTHFPFQAFALAVDQTAVPVTTFTTTQVQTYLGKETRAALVLRSLLDPTKYPTLKKEEKGKSAVVKDAASPAEDSESGGEQKTNSPTEGNASPAGKVEAGGF